MGMTVSELVRNKRKIRDRVRSLVIRHPIDAGPVRLCGPPYYLVATEGPVVVTTHFRVPWRGGGSKKRYIEGACSQFRLRQAMGDWKILSIFEDILRSS
jgi:hypothetical protein